MCRHRLSKSICMKNLNYGRIILELLLLALVIIFALRGCNVGDLQDEVALLNVNQTLLNSQRDSVQHLLDVKSTQYDSVFANYNYLSTELKKCNEQNKSIRSGYYKRGEELKRVNAENAIIAQTLNIMSSRNDSLQNELNMLNQRIASVENQKSQVEKISDSLSLSLKEKEEKMLADSIAEANKPIPPKESGFISINEIGGGFGLANTEVDYSRSLLSVNTIAAYRFNKHFITGFGTGLSVYNGGTMIPLYLDFRYILRERKFTPFIVADGGFLFVLKDFSSSGFFINPAIGASRKLSEKTSLHLSTGLLMQAAPAGPSSGGYRRSFINIKAGISFKGK